ncbi:hypothetical protein Tco_1474157 [Tanacetum coccineum]
MVPLLGRDPLVDGVRCQRFTCVRCENYLGEGFCSFCNSETGNSFANDSNPNSFNDPPNVFTHPPQPQYKSYSCELCRNDSHYGCDLSLCDDFSPINIYEEKSVTFSNPLFDSNDDFTSSDDESLSDEDVPKDNVKIYSNPFFEFDDEYISSNVNPLFDEVLENIESKDSYVSNLDEPALLVTPLSYFNEDECFEPEGDINEIDAFLEIDVFMDIEDGYHDSEGDIIYLESLLNNNSILNLPPEDCPDYEDSRARGFSFTRSSILRLLIYGNPIS